MATVRLCVLGEVNSGKTTLVKTFQELTQGSACKNHLTIGSPNLFHFKPKIADRETDLQVVDLPGEIRMREINATYFRNIDAYVLTLDLTHQQGLTLLEEHLLTLQTKPDFIDKPVVLACTKADAKAKFTSEDSVTQLLQKFIFIKKYFYVSSVIPLIGIKELFDYTIDITKASLQAQNEQNNHLKAGK